MQHFICPSILAADFTKLGKEVDSVISAGADMIHFDVMDNHYVPNLSFGPMVLQALKKTRPSLNVDVHLMAKPVDNLIESFIDVGADWITFHPEASEHIDRSIEVIKNSGIKCGIALNPATSTTCLEYIIDKLDLILVMSVNPGFGGQKFIPSSINKIKKIRKMIDDSGKEIRLQVDGGINESNIFDVSKAGADTFVAGSAIFNKDNYATAIKKMRAVLN